MDKMINWAPTVDIIVPCYNVENIIFKCIKSLLLQSYDKNKIKIYLVNDGSTDKTGEILDSFSNESQITIIHNNNNMSQAYTRNVGITKGNGEVICFLDSDMLVKTNWVDAHINTLSNKKIVGVVGDQEAPKDKKETSFDRYLYNKRRGARNFNEKLPISFQYFLFSNASLKRSVLNTINLFDEEFKNYGGEDTDLAIRIWEKYPNSLRFSRSAVCENHGEENLEKFCIKMFQYGKTNIHLLIKKHPIYNKELGFNYVHSIKGYLIFNPIIRYIVKFLRLIFDIYYLQRYVVIDSVIRGAREN